MAVDDNVIELAVLAPTSPSSVRAATTSITSSTMDVVSLLESGREPQNTEKNQRAVH